MRLPVYKLKLVRSGWCAFPPIDLEHPQLAAFFFHKLIGQAVVEHSAAMFFDGTDKRPIGSTIVAMGSLSRAPMLAREMYKAAIIANASSLVVSHNHPSGPSKPSALDIGVTRQLIRAGEIIGIQLLDHIIVTPSGNDFTSMRETGVLTLSWPAIPAQPAPPVGESSGASFYNSSASCPPISTK